MALINIFVPKSPEFITSLGVVTFDAVLEDTLSASVDYPTFPLEVGADASDHGIINPIEWSITGLVSNNPLSAGLTEASGVITNIFDPSTALAIASLSAGFLSGSDGTRAGAALQLLLGLMYQRQPFDIDAGDIQLQNMVIVSVERTKTAENEGGLEFVAELMELPLISTVITSNEPGQSQLRFGDPAKSQAAGLLKKGEISTTETTPADEALASEVI